MGKGKPNDTTIVTRISDVGGKNPDELVQDSRGIWHIVSFFVKQNLRNQWEIAIGDTTDQKGDESFIPEKLTRVSRLPGNFHELENTEKIVKIAGGVFEGQVKIHNDKKFMWRFFFLPILVVACLVLTGLAIVFS